jgi:kynureninase
LSRFFIDTVEALCGDELKLASPREASQRGSHVVFAHAQAYAVMQSLIARGIIGDFRPPDLMRFGFAPIYNGFEDAWLAAEALAQVLGSREWDRPEFIERQKVV